MNKEEYKKIEEYMLVCMKDCAHDKDHIYRVLYFGWRWKCLRWI